MSNSILDEIMKDLTFDRSDLNAVWENQPRLLMIYGAKLANAEKEMADAKRNLDLIESKLYSQIRAKISFDGARISESTIESKVKSDLNYTAARQRYDEAKYVADLYKHAVSAFNHRRDMIVQASKLAIIEIERLGTGRFMASTPSK